MIIRLALILVVSAACFAENFAPKSHGHGRYQHKGSPDDRGAYNFAYDTGTGDAHSMRMEYRDENGIVRGRYGYTDPKGKLRVVEYEAGPHGYHARGDVGPDEEFHKALPVHEPPHLSPIRMAGWSPNSNPIHEKRVGHTAVMLGGTADHPVKGYQLQRTQIHHKDRPVVVENIKHPMSVKSHGSVKLPHSTTSVKHHPKVVQPLVAVPVSTGKEHRHLSIKDSHKSEPHHAVSKASDHPVKGHQLKDPHPAKSVEHLHSNHKTVAHHAVPMKAPVVVKRFENHAPKSIISTKAEPVIIPDKIAHHKIHEYEHPLPITTKTRVGSHEEKGHQLVRPAAVKSHSHEYIKHSPKVIENHKSPVIRPVVVEQIPLKSLHAPKPKSMDLKHVEKVEHHPKILHNTHVPVPLKEPIIVESVEDHNIKGHQPIRPAHDRIHHHPDSVNHYPAPPVGKVHTVGKHAHDFTEKHIQKSVPVNKVGHHSKMSHDTHIPVPVKAPVIVESVEDHRAKGYQPIKPIHGKTHHHPDSVIHQPIPPHVSAHTVKKHTDTFATKHIKSAKSLEEKPLIVEKVEYHPQVVNKGGTLVTKQKPVIVSRLEHHEGNSRHLPAEHRDVDIVLEPALTYSKNPKSKGVLQPLTVHNIDVNPKEIRTTAEEHRHRSDNYHHHHDANPAVRVSSTSSIHRHSADDYHAHHSPRNHIESAHHRAYENYHANHPPQVPHRHSNRYYHGNHTHSYPVADDRPPIVVTSMSVSSDDVVLNDGSAPRVLARSARHHSDHSHEPRPVRYRPWSIYSPGSFYW